MGVLFDLVLFIVSLVASAFKFNRHTLTPAWMERVLILKCVNQADVPTDFPLHTQKSGVATTEMEKLN